MDSKELNEGGNEDFRVRREGSSLLEEAMSRKKFVLTEQELPQRAEVIAAFLEESLVIPPQPQTEESTQKEPPKWRQALYKNSGSRNDICVQMALYLVDKSDVQSDTFGLFPGIKDEARVKLAEELVAKVPTPESRDQQFEEIVRLSQIDLHGTGHLNVFDPKGEKAQAALRKDLAPLTDEAITKRLQAERSRVVNDALTPRRNRGSFVF